MPENTKPLPIIDEVSAPWFEAAREGRFLLQKRDADGGFQWYPRAHALGTLDEGVSWVEASGRGTIHTFTVVHRTANAEFAEDCPYVLAIVELDEGPRITTRIVDTPPDSVRIGQPVEVRFTSVSDDVVLPYFTVTEDAR